MRNASNQIFRFRLITFLQEFSIYLNPVNNKPPRIVNTGFTVNERAAAVISPSILDATDQDTDESVITFVLAAKPTHGTLQYDTQPIELGQCCQV